MAGKEATLQRGFSDGFRSGVEYAVHWGVLKGKIRLVYMHSYSSLSAASYIASSLSALQAYCTLRGIPTADLISDLLKEVKKQEEDERKAAFSELQDRYQQSVHQMEDPPKLPSSGQQGTVDSLSGSGQPSTVDSLPGSDQPSTVDSLSGSGQPSTVDSLSGTSRLGTVDSLPGSSPPPAVVLSLEQRLQTLTARFRQR